MWGNTTYSHVSLKRFYLVAVQHYVGKCQSNLDYIAGYPTHVSTISIDTTWGNMTYSSVSPERFYLVAAQRYVRKRQGNVVYIAGDPNLGTHFCCNY